MEYRTVKRHKKPNLFLSRARAFWRLSRKAQIAGNNHQRDWYAFQAQMAYGQYTKTQYKQEAADKC